MTGWGWIKPPKPWSTDNIPPEAPITLTMGTFLSKAQELDLRSARDQHLRHAWVDTIYAAPGKTAERVLVKAERERSNLIDQKGMYVAVSRRKAEAIVVTNNPENLVRGLNERG
jgi:hypothetical protein